MLDVQIVVFSFATVSDAGELVDRAVPSLVVVGLEGERGEGPRGLLLGGLGGRGEGARREGRGAGVPANPEVAVAIRRPSALDEQR